MTRFANCQPAQAPEIWIDLTARRLGRPVTTQEFMRQYKRNEETATNTLELLAKNRRIRKNIDADGKLIGWSRRAM